MKKFMKLAISLAKKANPFPNPRVGAVLVKGNKVIGIGYHKKAGLPHAEIEAIENAKLDSGDQKIVEGATLYVTLEPCSHTNKRTPPCTKAIIANKIKRVIFAMNDPNPLVSGVRELRSAGIEVNGPTDEKITASINKTYIQNRSKPSFVAVKMAMSIDGRTATRTGDSKWITGKKARRFVHKLRGQFDAIMVGAKTILTDNPRLTTRTKHNPCRIIIDGDLCIPLNSRVLKNPDGKTIVVTTERASKGKAKRIKNLIICGKAQVDLQVLLLLLKTRGIRRILIEGGSELNAVALNAGVVDKLYIFIAPKIIGGRDALGVVGGSGIAKMGEALVVKNVRVNYFGRDLLLECSL